ncbi:MAG: hypothetical protein PHX80_03930 [Candidatus Nanoarchaeia archaeon]|nr:hypothetical protein [Candidatus Nanoarchaeia archaeon]
MGQGVEKIIWEKRKKISRTNYSNDESPISIRDANEFAKREGYAKVLIGPNAWEHAKSIQA